MTKLKKEIPEITECKFIKDNEDGTKQYMIESKADIDLRKQLFEILPKKDITIFELKKAEKSLEDAFLTLIDAATEKDNKPAQKEEKAKKEEKKTEKTNKKESNKNEKKENTAKKQKGGKK